MVESWRGLRTLFYTSVEAKMTVGKVPEDLRVIFGEYSDIVENDSLTLERFLFSGGWQVWNPNGPIVDRLTTNYGRTIRLHDASSAVFK